jgi:DNA polymerase V
MLMHIDGNSFYASCERLFRPDLYGKPIAVLTNNDVLIIALNQECKDLGYKRGDVYYKIKKKCEAQGVEVFSSNYTLYSDICSRLNLLYNYYAPDVELYSIDESFLYFPDWENADYSEIGHEIRSAAQTEIGVPVSVGIAPNKTLAKLCNKLAKKPHQLLIPNSTHLTKKNYNPSLLTFPGVCEWAALDQDKTLADYPVGDIWGIGRSKTKFLLERGIKTSLDLKHYPIEKAQKHLTINGYKTVRELNGFCEIEKTEEKARQSIVVSRSFSGAVFDLATISGALARHTQEAVKRLRDEKLECKNICVYLMTNPHGEGEQYFNNAQAQLQAPTSYFPEILQSATVLLKQIFRNGYRYRKTMIALTGLTKQNSVQADLFITDTKKEKNEKLMAAFDEINSRYGRGTLRLGTSALTAKSDTDTIAPWEMKRELLSPAYTTRLADLPEVY